MSDWIYGIVAVMLFGTVILQVTPEGSYQKYVRLFLGALLMLTVIRPLYSWFGLSEEIRLSFEQGVLSSWIGATSLGDGWGEGGWQKPNHWEQTMKEQVNQKQEAWLGQALESTAREYGFLCLNHEVQWNAEGSWPEQLTLWLEKQEDEKERWPEDIAEHTTESTTGDAVDNSVGTVGISSVNPVKPVTGRDSDIEKNMQGEAYYEPSELRPLHQALQMVWQLEEGQIMLYWQR